MQRTIPFLNKLLLCWTTGLVCSMTVLRIVTRLAYEAGERTPVPLVAAALAAILLLVGLFYPFIWQRTSQRPDQANPDQAKLALWCFLLCYGIAIDLSMIGLQKWFGLQAHTHLAMLDGPFSSFSGEDLSWAYFGRSRPFFNIIGGFQLAGSLLLVFRQTKLLGVFILLPVMVNISLMNYFYEFSPGELGHAVVLLLGLLYLLLAEHDRLLFFFLGRQPGRITSPPMRTGAWNTAIRLSVLYIPVLLIVFFFHLPEKDASLGKYQVTRMWIDGKPVFPKSCADSVLTQVYLDAGHDCVFQYNGWQRWTIGNYSMNRKTQRFQVIWHYPAGLKDTLVARVNNIPGGLGIDGRMGQLQVRMDWQKVW